MRGRSGIGRTRDGDEVRQNAASMLGVRARAGAGGTGQPYGGGGDVLTERGDRSSKAEVPKLRQFLPRETAADCLQRRFWQDVQGRYPPGGNLSWHWRNDLRCLIMMNASGV